MADETVVIDPIVETIPVAEVKEETKTPSLADTEKAWRESETKRRGPEFAKKFNGTVETKVEEKKPESKTEVKTETKIEEKKVEPVIVPKPKTGFGKVIRRAVEESTRPLLAKIQELEAKVTPIKTEEKTVEVAVEPKREEFKTTEEWVAAIRKFDKDQAKIEQDKGKVELESAEARALWDRRIDDLRKGIDEFKKTHTDYDEVRSRAPLIGRKGDDEYNQVLGGVLIAAGPEAMYELAKDSKKARAVADIDSPQLIAVSNSDVSKDVILWLAAHPDDIEKINGMNPVKAQKFVGQIEAKIEAEAEKAEATKRASSGKGDTPLKEEKVTEATEVKAPQKAKPEPPPPLKGSAPASLTDWRDSSSMSLADRERLYMEDPKNKRR
jgi:hypothetical protein